MTNVDKVNEYDQESGKFLLEKDDEYLITPVECVIINPNDSEELDNAVQLYLNSRIYIGDIIKPKELVDDSGVYIVDGDKRIEVQFRTTS